MEGYHPPADGYTIAMPVTPPVRLDVPKGNVVALGVDGLFVGCVVVAGVAWAKQYRWRLDP